MSDKIKEGDVVVLKSGGPEMTVSHRNVEDSEQWVCVWFEGQNKKIDSFKEKALEKY